METTKTTYYRALEDGELLAEKGWTNKEAVESAYEFLEDWA